jgi:hypothetical protein
MFTCAKILIVFIIVYTSVPIAQTNHKRAYPFSATILLRAGRPLRPPLVAALL